MKFDIRSNHPEVSISVIAYNNAPYIRECLDSILAQETDFSYEICLGEDGSSDGTREICSEYAEKHPEKIRLFLRARDEAGRDLYKSQGVYNYIETTQQCRGQFVAFCDGDDAWPDPKKLQLQYEILKNEASVALVHSDYNKMNAVTGCQIEGYNRKKKIEMNLGTDSVEGILNLLLGDYTIAASSVMARTRDVQEILDSNPDLFQTLPMGDTQTWCELLRRGGLHYIPRALAMYRITKESASNSLSALKKYEFVAGTADLGMKLIGRYDLPPGEIIAFKVKSCNRYALLGGDRTELDFLHADYTKAFDKGERLLYRAGQLPGIRNAFACLFQLRYLYNHLRN